MAAPTVGAYIYNEDRSWKGLFCKPCKCVRFCDHLQVRQGTPDGGRNVRVRGQGRSCGSGSRDTGGGVTVGRGQWYPTSRWDENLGWSDGGNCSGTLGTGLTSGVVGGVVLRAANQGATIAGGNRTLIPVVPALQRGTGKNCFRRQGAVVWARIYIGGVGKWPGLGAGVGAV